ncbi:KDM8, partial [Symbiodinium sp. KB8]
LARAWRAASWSFEHLASLPGADVQVPLSMSLEESSSATRKRSISLAQYCKSLASGSGHPGYVKQCELLDMFPFLQEDIGELPFPDSHVFVTPYAWLGAPGSHTGLHQDDEDNVLVVLKGRKRVRLAHPSAAPWLYVNDKYDSGTVCADASLLFPDPARHPLLAKVPLVLDVEMGPGDALLFPADWWHEAVSDSASISLNFFASTWTDMLVRGLPRCAGIAAHELGLYRPGHCVCHSAKTAVADGDAESVHKSQLPLEVWWLLAGGAVMASVAAVWAYTPARQAAKRALEQLATLARGEGAAVR